MLRTRQVGLNIYDLYQACIELVAGLMLTLQDSADSRHPSMQGMRDALDVLKKKKDHHIKMRNKKYYDADTYSV